MGPYEVLAGMTEFGGQNLAYNLEFIPADKLTWKPEGALSALEVAHHVAAALTHMRPLLSGKGFSNEEIPMPQDLATAQEIVKQAAAAFASDLRKVDPAILNNPVDTPMGPLPLSQVITWGPFDLLHHHGQIAYIQTMLGDKESHFVGM